MSTIPQPETQLHEALTAALTEHGIPTEFWYTGGGYTSLIVPAAGPSKINITDVNSHVIEPLSEYSGLMAWYYATRDGEGPCFPIYESPDLGVERDPVLFDAEVAEAIAAIKVCRQMCAIRPAQSAWRRERRLAHPQPAEPHARLHRAADGTTSLTVATSFRASAEEVTAALVCHFSRLAVEGKSLEAPVTLPTLLDILAEHARPCSFGPHDWSAFTDADHPARRWAEKQARTLLPALSWPVE